MLSAAILCSGGAFAQITEYPGYSLVWSDEFNGGYSNADANTGLDLDSWGYETGGGGWGTSQRDVATKSKENIEVSNGTLKIRTHRHNPNQTDEYTSGRVTSQNKRDFLYGKIEARIRTSNMTENGRGFAFWMMPNGIPAGYSTLMWPQGGEIDIFEYNGMYPEYNLGSVHYCWGWNNNQWAGDGQHAQASNIYFKTDRTKSFKSAGRDGCTGNSPTKDKNNLLGADWHVYGINWYSNRIEFYVDQDVYHIFRIDYEAWCGDFNLVNNKMQVTTGWNYPKQGYNNYWRTFENPFYIILSAGVGGPNTYGGDITSGNNPYQWTCTTEIDWVRCYKMTSNDTQGPVIDINYEEVGNSVSVTPTRQSGANIAQVEYIVDKVPVASTKSTSPFTYTFNPTADTHKIYARACNANGYWGNWAQVRYTKGGGEPGECTNNFAAYTRARYVNCTDNWACDGADDGLVGISGSTATCNVGDDSRAHFYAVYEGLDTGVEQGRTYEFSGKIKATKDVSVTLCIENREKTDTKMFQTNTLALKANVEKSFSLTADAASPILKPDLSLNIENGPANTSYTITNIVLRPADCQTTPVDEVAFDSDLDNTEMCYIYPNPADAYAYVNSAKGIESVEVFTLTGKNVLSADGNGATTVLLDVMQLSDGYYLVKVINTDGSGTSLRMIKQ